MATANVIESFDARGTSLRVDRQQSVIRGVKVLGLESANGRTYPRETIRKALPLYEGAKVNVDHPNAKDPTAPRKYSDRLGTLKNVAEGGDGAFADLHINPKHPLAEQLLWDAEHSPESVGLSPNHRIKASTKAGKVIVESIEKVNSVDLVADPATTRSLFEHTEGSMSEITLEAVRACPEILKALKAEAVSEFNATEERKAQVAELADVKTKLDAFEAKEAVAAKRAKVAKIVTEAKLPKEAVTEVFVDQLLGAANDATIGKLIEDRKALVSGYKSAAGGAKSRDQFAVEGRESTGSGVNGHKEFAAALKSR